jgi:hypothetical protein
MKKPLGEQGVFSSRRRGVPYRAGRRGGGRSGPKGGLPASGGATALRLNGFSNAGKYQFLLLLNVDGIKSGIKVSGNWQFFVWDS